MESITIIGKRWFDKVNGNTYHSSTIYVDGDLVGEVPFKYGYGECYLQTAFNFLHLKGFVGEECKFPYWLYCKDRGIKLITEVSDVTRKKDL